MYPLPPLELYLTVNVFAAAPFKSFELLLSINNVIVPIIIPTNAIKPTIILIFTILN